MDSDEVTGIHSALCSMKGWETIGAGDYIISPMEGGLTNKSYLIKRGEITFVLRLAGDNTGELGIDRSREKEVALVTSLRGINVPVVDLLLPHGDMLTRWIKGKTWNVDEFNVRNNLVSAAHLLAKVHQIPPVEGIFNPYQDIDERITLIQGKGLSLPENLKAYLEKTAIIRKKRETGPLSKPVFCHNDPFYNNFLESEEGILLLDWEFAGTGDSLFDVVSATQVLKPEGREIFLMSYLGAMDYEKRRDSQKMAEIKEHLEDMRFVVMFWNGLWAIIQSSHNLVDHDFSVMAQNIFKGMDDRLSS